MAPTTLLTLALLTTSTLALPWYIPNLHNHHNDNKPAPYPTLTISTSTQGVFETHPAGPTGTGTVPSYPTGTAAPIPTGGYMHKRWDLGPPMPIPMGTGTAIFPVPTGYSPDQASPFGSKDRQLPSKQFNGVARKGNFHPHYPVDDAAPPAYAQPTPTGTAAIPTGTGAAMPTGS